tara:strand:+ start:24402 stop:25397 length:996 start_codon:yes stop_codon:yes gene_type:complete
MINSVRNTVLAIANKNNYGYISPQDFNLYAKQAQMDMFENYFYQYNNWIIRQNQKTSGIGYADIVKGLEEVIDSFSVSAFLIQNGFVPGAPFGTDIISNRYFLPNDYYLINKVFYYPTLLFTGVGGFVAGTGTITEPSAPFLPIPVSAPFPALNSIVVCSTTLLSASVVAVPNSTTLVINGSIGTSNGYKVYSNKNIVKVERVSQNKIFNLTSSNLTSPNKQYPAYTLDGLSGTNQEFITVYPETIQNQGDIQVQYIRYPKDPKWTYISIGAQGSPIFNSSQPDYQDFELPLSDEPMLVAKILQYVGIEIRESDVVNFAMDQEEMDNQQTS